MKVVFNSGELVRARKKATPMAMSESRTPPRLPRVSYAMGIVHRWGYNEGWWNGGMEWKEWRVGWESRRRDGGNATKTVQVTTHKNKVTVRRSEPGTKYTSHPPPHTPALVAAAVGTQHVHPSKRSPFDTFTLR